MLVYNTGAVPGATVTCLLLVVDEATTGCVLIDETQTTVNDVGAWELTLTDDVVAATTFDVTGTFWRVVEPRPGGTTNVWNVTVPPGIDTQITGLTAVSPTPPTPVDGAPTGPGSGGGTPTVINGGNASNN